MLIKLNTEVTELLAIANAVGCLSTILDLLEKGTTLDTLREVVIEAERKFEEAFTN